MRIRDLAGIALKNLRGKWMVLPALCIAVSMFCFCFAGTVLTTVEYEKSMPCELLIMSESSNITDSTIAQIYEIPDVSAVTPILKVAMNINVDAYSAQLTLVGIDNGYLDEEFSQGGIFPEESVMPYIVLNHEAYNLFEKQGENDNEMNEPKIDWLSEDITLHEGDESREVTSKISGILLENEEHQEPTGYISLSCAKQLLYKSGQSTDSTEARARISNIGCAESITNTLYTKGLNVSNTNADIQARWDMQMKEMTYLSIVGVICALCAVVLGMAWIKISLYEQNKQLISLKWIGLKSNELIGFYVVQVLLITLIGISVGILIGTSLPSFIPMEHVGTSIFALKISFGVCVLSAAALVVLNMISCVIIHKIIKLNIS